MKNYSRYSCKYWICFYVELFILVFLPYLALFILMWSNYSCLLDCCLSFRMIWATSYNLETLWCNLLSAEFERLENPTPQGCHNSHATFKSPFPDISYENWNNNSLSILTIIRPIRASSNKWDHHLPYQTHLCSGRHGERQTTRQATLYPLQGHLD